MVGISGQSLLILGPLPTIDVLWSVLHMVHEDRSLMSYDSFYWTFRTARTQRILARSFLMKLKSDWKRITLHRKTSFKKEIKNIGR
jgi:hypothetical protein